MCTCQARDAASCPPVDLVTGVVVTLLPVALIALLLILSLRWRKRRETAASATVEPWPRTRSIGFLVVVLVVASLLAGALDGWSLDTLLLPVGWLVTGLALVLLDRSLDRRLHGRSPNRFRGRPSGSSRSSSLVPQRMVQRKRWVTHVDSVRE